MSEKEADETFWERADKFIKVANAFCAQTTRGKVSSSFLYAAARFNSFIVAASSKTSEEMQRDRDKAVEYFVKQYRKMLEENLDDHIHNFEKYMKENDS